MVIKPPENTKERFYQRLTQLINEFQKRENLQTNDLQNCLEQKLNYIKTIQKEDCEEVRKMTSKEKPLLEEWKEKYYELSQRLPGTIGIRKAELEGEFTIISYCENQLRKHLCVLEKEIQEIKKESPEPAIQPLLEVKEKLRARFGKYNKTERLSEVEE